ncbi:MAG: LptF/LptG family permease [Cyanobacteria bacterium HKST-UBA02]|nr:LptF/LptG family permease [Cyanobacteria bacterium HKST-UBA02]
MMRLLDRYILAESMQLLLIGAVVILGVFFGTVEFRNCLDMMNAFGLPLQTVLSVTLLQMPTGIVYCLPAGVLVATMFLLIRQHNDSEIIALEVSGVPLSRIMLPYLVMSIVACASVFLLTEFVAPQARLLSEKMTMLGVYGAACPFSARTSITHEKVDGSIDQQLLFGRPRGKFLQGFVALKHGEAGAIKLIWAEEAQWKSGYWNLRNGRVFDFFGNDKNTGSSDKRTGSSDKRTGSSDKRTGSSDKRTGSSGKRTGSSDKRTGSSGKRTDVSEAGTTKSILAGDVSHSSGVGGTFASMSYGGNKSLISCIQAGPLSHLSKTTSQMRQELDEHERAGRPVPLELLLQYYRRFSHPISCVLLLLAAAPVALLRSRRSRSTAIVYGGVLVVVYFVLQQVSLSLAINDRLSPIVGAWLPSGLLCLLGLALTAVMRRR